MIKNQTLYIPFLIIGIIFSFQFIAMDRVEGLDSDEIIEDIVLEEAELFNDDLGCSNRIFKEIHRGNLSMYVTLKSPENLKFERFLNSYFENAYDYYIKEYNNSHYTDKRVIHINCIDSGNYKNILSFKFNKSIYTLENEEWKRISSRIFFLNFSDDNGDRLSNSDVLRLNKIGNLASSIRSDISKKYKIKEKEINLDLIKEALLNGDQFFIEDGSIEFLININDKNYISKFKDLKSFINRKKLNRKLDENKPMVCLTYDDGPLPKNSKRIVDILEKNKARATFFELGLNVRKYPEMVLLKHEAGMEVEGHSFSHSNFVTLSDDAVKREISATDIEFKEIIGKTTRCFRPPYGSTNKKINRIVNKPIIFWSVDTEDWRSRDVDKIYAKVFEHENLDNKIILLHSIHENTVYATAIIVPLLKQKGYQIVTLEELIKYKRKNQLINCKKYY